MTSAAPPQPDALDVFLEQVAAAAAALRAAVPTGVLVRLDSPMPQIVEQPFGQKLRALRERADMTQTQAAELLRANPATVYRWEAGKQKQTHLGKRPNMLAGMEAIGWYTQEKKDQEQRLGRKLSNDELDELFEAARQRVRASRSSTIVKKKPKK